MFRPMSNSSHSGHVGGDPGRLDPEKIQKCIAEGDFDVVSDGVVCVLFLKKDGSFSASFSFIWT